MPPLADARAGDVIRQLGLRPHPEGGHFRETFRDAAADSHGRSRSTAILFLLAQGEVSAWHRIDAVEIWHFYAGSPLALSLCEPGQAKAEHRLGADIFAGETPQLVVPQGCWQSARTLGGWTLVGCTVAPGFQFDGFELASPGWQPI